MNKNIYFPPLPKAMPTPLQALRAAPGPTAAVVTLTLRAAPTPAWLLWGSNPRQNVFFFRENGFSKQLNDIRHTLKKTLRSPVYKLYISKGQHKQNRHRCSTSLLVLSSTLYCHSGKAIFTRTQVQLLF